MGDARTDFFPFFSFLAFFFFSNRRRAKRRERERRNTIKKHIIIIITSYSHVSSHARNKKNDDDFEENDDSSSLSRAFVRDDRFCRRPGIPRHKSVFVCCCCFFLDRFSYHLIVVAFWRLCFFSLIVGLHSPLPGASSSFTSRSVCLSGPISV